MSMLDFIRSCNEESARRVRDKALLIAGSMWDHVYGLDKGKLSPSECDLLDRLCTEYSDPIGDYNFESLVNCLVGCFNGLIWGYKHYHEAEYEDDLSELTSFVVDNLDSDALLAYAADDYPTQLFEEWDAEAKSLYY